MKRIEVTIIKTDGTEEKLNVLRDGVITRIEELVGAKLLATVNLRAGRVMFVDDGGYESTPTKALKPVNRKATDMYWSVCRPGNKHEIVGDVAIVRNADFE